MAQTKVRIGLKPYGLSLVLACLVGTAVYIGLEKKSSASYLTALLNGSPSVHSQSVPNERLQDMRITTRRSPTWRHPSGKNRKNGSLSAEKNPLQRIHLYSAFFDDREKSAPHLPFVIRVIAAIKSAYFAARDPFQCVLYCAGNRSAPEIITLYKKGNVRRLSDAKVINHTSYRALTLTIRPRKCSNYEPRVWVGIHNSTVPLILENFVAENPSVEIEQPHRVLKVFDVGICTAAYYYLDPYRVVEWIEMQKILGVTGIILYNSGLNAEASHVWDRYYSEGYIDVRYASRSYEAIFHEETRLLNQLVLNDCLYRYMHTFKYMMVIDTDELILPRTVPTLPKMLSLVSREYPDVVDFHFMHGRFVMQICFGSKPDYDKPVFSWFLRYRYRTKFRANKSFHLKSIFIPEYCLQSFNHYCARRFNTKVQANVTTFVDPNVAYVHHYRDVFGPEIRTGLFAGNGSIIKANLVRDDAILAFEHKLRSNLKIRLAELDLLDSAGNKISGNGSL